MDKNVFVLDGGLATELEHKGHDINNDPLWSARLLASNPDAIVAVHRSFLQAGCDVIITATYQASLEGFRKHLEVTEERAGELIELGVNLAKRARDEYEQEFGKDVSPLVAASIGPYGACLHDGSEYTGTYINNVSRAQLKDFHRPRIRHVMSAKPDLLAIETIPALSEALVLVELLDEFPDAHAWVSFQCSDEIHTAYGDDFAVAVKQLSSSPRVIAVGVNCCSPHLIGPLLRHAASSTNGKPFVVYPNSGEEWTNSRWCSEKHVSIDDWQTLVPAWLSLGARWVGGCCRTRPDDIKTIHSAASAWITSSENKQIT